MFVSLAREDGNDLSSLIKIDDKYPVPPTDLFYGQRAGIGLILDDIEGLGKSIFYVFHDLSVRVPGVFVIKIEVVDMFSRKVVQSLETKRFEVFSPKKFPGMMGKDWVS